jgi:peroxiredoxin
MTESSSPIAQLKGRPSPILIVFLIFPIMGIIAAAALALSSLNTAPPPTPQPVSLQDTSLIDKPAPNFELAALDGGRYRLSNFRGRVVFINFWATWCEPCQRELPAFTHFMEQQGDSGAMILALNMAENVDNIQQYFTDHSISGINVLLDQNLDVQSAYGVNQFPTTFVLDPAGVVRYRHLGEMTEDDLFAYVDELSPSGQQS